MDLPCDLGPRSYHMTRVHDLPHDRGTRIYHVSWVHKATLCTPLLGVHPREQRLSENKLVTTRGDEIGEGKTGMGDEKEQTDGHKINKW